MKPLTLLSHLTCSFSLFFASSITYASDEVRSLQVEPTPPPSSDFFQPVNNLIGDLKNQGVTVNDPADRMLLRYSVASPCAQCSVYLGTGYSNPQKDINNSIGVNLGLGFSISLPR